MILLKVLLSEMESLPHELIWVILEYVTEYDNIINVRLVCKLFNSVVSDDRYWVYYTILDSERLDEKFGDRWWKRFCFEHRMTYRYYRMMGCAGDNVKELKLWETGDRFAYHLLFSGDVENAVINTNFPIPVCAPSGRYSYTVACIESNATYDFKDGQFIDSCGYKFHLGIDLYKMRGIKSALLTFARNDFRMRTEESHLIDGRAVPGVYPTESGIKSTKKLLKFGVFRAEEDI